jgi:hypothetical protein
MIILSMLRYGETSYGSASKAALRKLDLIHHSRNFHRVQNRKRIMRSGITHTNGNERRKHDEDLNKNIDKQKPPYQITNDKLEHLRQLCNETRIIKIILHTSSRTSRTNGHRWKKTPDYIRTPWYTDDGKSMDWSLCKMRKGTPIKIFRA